MGIIQAAVRRRLGPPPVLTYGNGRLDVGIASDVSRAITGGQSPYSYSRSGTLPSGISFSTSTGLFTGTPTGANGKSYDGTDFPQTITVTDADGQQDTDALTLSVYQEAAAFSDGSPTTFTGTAGSRGVRLGGAFTGARLWRINNGSAIVLGEWYGPWRGALNEGDFEARATVLAGSPSSGTFNTWLRLSNTRTWLSTGVGFQVLVELSLVGTSSSIGEAVFTFN